MNWLPKNPRRLLAIATLLAAAAPGIAAAADYNVTKLDEEAMDTCNADGSHCLAHIRDSSQFPMAIAVGVVGAEIDKTAIQARLTGSGGSFTTFPADGRNLASGEGIVWQVAPSALTTFLRTSLSNVEEGFDMRLRLTKMNGGTKSCPTIKFRGANGDWQYYDGGWKNIPTSGASFTAIQAALLVPTKGLICK